MAQSVSPKIKNLDELAALLEPLRKQGKRIVHCHGVFDLLHLGHIRHFESAKRHGDVLVVTLTPDQWVNKGPHRPAFSHDHRAEVLASLSCVDYVAVNRWPNAVETIALLKPTFYAKGAEYRDAPKDVTGGIVKEEDAVRRAGGQIVYTDDVTFSSSTLINRHMSTLSKSANEFIAGFTKRHSAEQVVGYLEKASTLKVLVIGETIIDDYHYCQTLGKSGKEPILAVRFSSSEKFAGGVAAVANHLASFCDRVKMLSLLGEEDSHEDFVRSKLSGRVDPEFLFVPHAPTILKRRFIERYPFQKMFEVYLMKEDQIDTAQIEGLCATLKKQLPNYDVVVVTDYGHGMLAPPVVELLCKEARCLAVNTQANAANHGFNTISKYPRADYACVSESELRLDARQPTRDLLPIVSHAAERLACRRLMITRGNKGMMCYSPGEGIVEVPSLTDHFVDRVGAGDAVFAITSLCLAQGAPADIMGLIGNAVGAMAVGTVGNRSAIDRAALIKTLVSLLH